MLQMIKRIQVLSRIADCNLDEGVTRHYSLDVLQSACDRIEAHDLKQKLFNIGLRIQKELICNEQFAGYYRELLDNEVSTSCITAWLESADQFGEILTERYPATEMIRLHSCGIRPHQVQYECLKCFGSDLQDEALRPALVKNLNTFHSQKKKRLSSLTEADRDVLKLSYFSQYICISERTVLLAIARLASNEALRALMEFLFVNRVVRNFTEDDFKALAHLEHSDLELIRRTFCNLGCDPGWMERFLDWWLSNQCLRHDLQWFAQRSEPLTDEEKHQTLDTWIGYLNALYSRSLDVPFSSISPIQYNVLIYAIAHGKKRFLRMVSEHFEDFSALGRESFLLSEDFYKRCNLNALEPRDFLACAGEAGKACNLRLLEQREYTPQELKLLCYAEPAYIQFYGMLADIGVDRKLIVLRELLKGHLLEGCTEADLQTLARLLSQKPLSAWRQKELSHISGLSAADSVRVLRAYDQLQPVLPELITWEDAVFASRNAERIQCYGSWSQMRDDLIHADQDWVALAKELELDEGFIQSNKSHIIYFLMQEGAEMTRLYYDYTENKEAFRRIILAELMGEFRTLKYYPDDLNKEINFPTTPQQQNIWQANTTLGSGGIQVEEVDDYYSTLRLGTLPYHTCLSYVDGQHRDCLLSGYDSNKKILLAKKDGRILGRAVIRLTKGRYHPPGGVSTPTLEFADLTKSSEPKLREERYADQLTLFLERPYLSGAGYSETAIISRLFIELVEKKAARMLAAPVLAPQYLDHHAADAFVRTTYYLYVSKSKGGAQYLDSMGGENSVSKEGSFKSAPFLVPQEHALDIVS